MDVTPQLIEQIDFSEKFRGYDPDQVDDFLERVGATLSELIVSERDARERADRAEQEVRSLRERLANAPKPSATGAPAAPALTDEQEIEQASRTLLMAKRTADAAIAEARQEAGDLLATARSQSEQLAAEAQTHRDDLLRRAREDAEREFGDQRNRFAQEIRDLDARKRELHSHVDVFEQRISEQRADLEHVHEKLSALVKDPGVLRPRPPVDVDMNPSKTPPPIDVPPARGAESDRSSAFYADDPDALPDVPAVEERSEGEYVPASDVSVLDPDDGPEVARTEQPPLSGTGSSDPWGPGSWSDAVGGDRPSDAGEPETFDPASVDDDPGVQRVDEPTQAHDSIEGGDRYLRDLDEAVNAEQEDAAMKDFFEGDDPTDGRRFGRRR